MEEALTVADLQLVGHLQTHARDELRASVAERLPASVGQ